LVPGCDGAPLLPLLFIIVNIGFNIALLHLLKISSAVVSCLASTFSGMLVSQKYSYTEVDIVYCVITTMKYQVIYYFCSVVHVYGIEYSCFTYSHDLVWEVYIEKFSACLDLFFGRAKNDFEDLKLIFGIFGVLD